MVTPDVTVLHSTTRHSPDLGCEPPAPPVIGWEAPRPESRSMGETPHSAFHGRPDV